MCVHVHYVTPLCRWVWVSVTYIVILTQNVLILLLYTTIYIITPTTTVQLLSKTVNFISTGVAGRIKHVVAGNHKRVEDYVDSSLRRIFDISQDWQVRLDYRIFPAISTRRQFFCNYIA